MNNEEFIFEIVNNGVDIAIQDLESEEIDLTDKKLGKLVKKYSKARQEVLDYLGVDEYGQS